MKSLFLKIIGFLLPFELLVSYGAHGIFKPLIGEFYRGIFNGVWGSLILILLLSYTKIKRKTIGFLGIAVLFVFAGFWEYIVTLALGGMSMEALSQFFCGFFFPGILLVTLINLPQKLQDDFFKSWYLGTIMIVVIAFGTTFYYYQYLPEWFKDKDPAFKLISFRYANEEEGTINGMMIVLGNFNKASNYLLMMLLFSVRLLGTDGRNRRLLQYFWLLATITLLVLFSRLALLLLPLVYYASGINQHLGKILKSRYTLALLILFTGIVIWRYGALIQPTMEYLVYSKFDDNSEDLGVLGTGANRFQAWALLAERLGNIDIWIHGLGVGQFGIEHGGSKDLGTHNLIFDHFFASGLLVPLIIIYMCTISWIRGAIKKDRLILFGIPIIMALFFREYSFSYLFVTTHGGLIFLILVFLAYKKYSGKLKLPGYVADSKAVLLT